METVLFLITSLSHSSTLFLIPGLIGNSEFRNRFCGSKIMCSSCNKCVTCNKTFYISVSIFKPVAFEINHNHVLNWQYLPVFSSMFHFTLTQPCCKVPTVKFLHFICLSRRFTDDFLLQHWKFWNPKPGNYLKIWG